LKKNVETNRKKKKIYRQTKKEMNNMNKQTDRDSRKGSRPTKSEEK
jgi:hypothetical protein